MRYEEVKKANKANYRMKRDCFSFGLWRQALRMRAVYVCMHVCAYVWRVLHATFTYAISVAL